MSPFFMHARLYGYEMRPKDFKKIMRLFPEKQQRQIAFRAWVDAILIPIMKKKWRLEDGSGQQD